MQALCDAAFAALAAHSAIPNPATLKIRAIPYEIWKIGTDPDSFVHADLALLPGRDEVTKADLARTLLAVLTGALPEVGSLTVNVSELSPSYSKRVL